MDLINMEFNRIALTIILICTISVIFPITHGQSPSEIKRLEQLTFRSNNAIDQATPLNDRLGAMFNKCGDYMKEKAQTGIFPSLFVVEACTVIAEEFNGALQQLFTNYQAEIQKIEK